MPLSFKEFLQRWPEEAIEETSKPGQPLAPPKRPRSPKALVNVPHKRNKATQKITGKPLPVPPVATKLGLSSNSGVKTHMEETKLLNPEKNPNKSEKAVAVVVPQKSGLEKFLRHYHSPRGGGAHRSGYAHARMGHVGGTSRRNPPKHLKV